MIGGAAVKGLAYVGLSSPRVDQWTDMMESIMGATPDPSESGVLFRIDEWIHRVEVTPGTHEALTYLGWEVPDHRSLDELLGILANHGHASKLITGDAAHAARKVEAFAQILDPAGNFIELACGPDRSGRPPESPWGCSFVTGDQGLGHVFFVTPKFEEMLEFYRLLGFRESDRFADDAVRFLHCNPREHSIALADSSIDLGLPTGFNHLMLEVDDESAVGRAYDRCIDEDRPIAYSLGKHTNDLMFSFYMRSPGPWNVELGYGGRRIDPQTWHPTVMESESIWGHRPQGSDF